MEELKRYSVLLQCICFLVKKRAIITPPLTFFFFFSFPFKQSFDLQPNMENPPPYPGNGPTAPGYPAQGPPPQGYPGYPQQGYSVNMEQPNPAYPNYPPGPMGPGGPYPGPGQPPYGYAGQPQFGWQGGPPPGPMYGEAPKNTGKHCDPNVLHNTCESKSSSTSRTTSCHCPYTILSPVLNYLLTGCYGDALGVLQVCIQLQGLATRITHKQ